MNNATDIKQNVSQEAYLEVRGDVWDEVADYLKWISIDAARLMVLWEIRREIRMELSDE